MRESEELHLGRQQFVQGGEVESAFAIAAEQRHIFQRGAGGLGGLLPRDEVGVVLHFRGEHDVARLEVRMAPAAGDDVDALGRAASKNDLGGIGSVDEFRDAGAGALVAVGRAHRERVEPTMDVAVVAFVVVHEGVDHAARFLRSGTVVKIDQRLAVDLLVQDREVSADIFPVGHGVKIVLVIFLILLR